MTEAQKLDRVFSRLGINFDVPGFHDTPEFKRAEQDNPTLLETYGDFVEARSYSASYLAWARPIILDAAAYLHRELVRDGRPGACIDASIALSQFLDRLGVWN